jgi:uncharacterized protein YjbJ (UPF0337 family)
MDESIRLTESCRAVHFRAVTFLPSINIRSGTMNEDQIRGAANTIGGRVQRAAGALGGDHGLEAEGAIRETAGRVQAKAGEAVDNARDAIAHRPLGAILSGFGVGILVGMLLARRD